MLEKTEHLCCDRGEKMFERKRLDGSDLPIMCTNTASSPPPRGPAPVPPQPNVTIALTGCGAAAPATAWVAFWSDGCAAGARPIAARAGHPMGTAAVWSMMALEDTAHTLLLRIIIMWFGHIFMTFSTR